ncbi:MAG TPA: right-handed parallel beta-helix repeat-containing protein, partial [Clostridia bacterium]|nr:right-handed parallel beta-helix repeat-containing protein [Clostridia bacterium]
MKTILIGLSYLLICGNICFSQTIINSGDVSGLWEKSKSPYQIFGEIEIPNNQTLTIEKGVKVEFNGHYKLNVQGRLLAMGEKRDSIVFTGKDTTKWGGIRFVIVPTANDTSKLSYCVVENCYASSGQLPRAATTDDYGGGIYILSSKLTINNSCIRYNKAYIAGGIYCAGNITSITNTIIRNNEAITECGGLYLSMSSPKVIGCLITNNKADQIGAIRIENANALLINNTICNNISNNPVLGSIFIRGNSKIFNTIIYYNTPNLTHIDDQGSYPEIQFCDIENGISGFLDYYPSVKGNFDGIYKNNIETPPVFIDMQNGNYRLGISSCINTGTPDPMVLIPKYDIDGNPRINIDSKARIDIGAYEYQGLTPNRKPYCNNMDPQFFLRSQKSILAINYFDADPNDKLTFKVTTNSAHVAVRILSINDSTIITEIDPEINWRGESYVYVNINDNSNSTNSIGNDSIKVFISNRFKGDINTKVIFEDTVLVVGDITIKELGDLEIRPGSFVEFQDWYKIRVLGKLNILGTKLNKVILNATDTTVYYYGNNKRDECGWGGIEFIDVNRTDTMHINYCLVKNTGLNKIKNRENGAVSITDSRNIHFNNCSFESNYLGGSGKKNSGIYAENSHNLQLKNCDFFDGYTIQAQGTYVNVISSALVVDSCKFHDTDNNQGDFNWCYIVCDKSAVQIRNSSFFNNIGRSIISSYAGSLIVENCTIKDNKSAGIDIYTEGALIHNNVFINNNVAINCNLVTAKIINNLIAYSQYKCGCSNFNGCAINLDNAGTTLIANNTIVNNTQDSNGNTVYASYCSPTIVNNIFWNNIREGVGF